MIRGIRGQTGGYTLSQSLPKHGRPSPGQPPVLAVVVAKGGSQLDEERQGRALLTASILAFLLQLLGGASLIYITMATKLIVVITSN